MNIIAVPLHVFIGNNFRWLQSELATVHINSSSTVGIYAHTSQSIYFSVFLIIFFTYKKYVHEKFANKNINILKCEEIFTFFYKFKKQTKFIKCGIFLVWNSSWIVLWIGPEPDTII